jgi:pilus assembly protein FimV
MTTSKNNQKEHENTGQVDDLTRFLDEDFDTDDVDLFEFTTEEDSPLTGLKSIVLSLDWEITDETLQDLADEIEHIKGLEKFQADKVSLVYLQGLAKIGHYIQSEGAHAHPNSIKLLLTLYYDFEKVLSSETITGSEITALLKADVRKFKILQYQIAQKHGVDVPVLIADEAKKLGLAITDSEALKGIRAVILELDWEITDEGLDRLTEQLNLLKEKYEDDRFIQVLVHGLFSLNTYIIDERAQAHPEAFSLLHSFCDGLAILIEDKELRDEDRQTIVVEQVNSLNNLKALIAGAVQAVDVLEDEAIEEYEEEDLLTTEESPAPEALEEFEPSIEETIDEDREIAPALAGDEAEGTEILEEAPPEELAEKLESFFGEEAEVPPPEPAPAPETAAPDEHIIAPALTGEESEEDLDIAPALAGDEAEGTEILEEEPQEELAGNLDLFFGSDEKVPPPEPSPEPVAVAEEAVEEELEELEPVAEETFDEDLEITPALAGDESEGSEIQEEELQEELAGNLDLFFGTEEEVAPFEGAEPSPVTEKITEEVAQEPAEEIVDDQEEIVPALAGSPEEGGFAAEGELEEPPEGLAENLEGFFGEEKPAEVAEVEAPAESVEETSSVTEETDEVLEALFDSEEAVVISDTEVAPALTTEEDEEDIDLITPALSADDEEGTEILEEEPPEELADKLEAFFGSEETVAEKTEVTEEEEMLLTPALAEEEELNIPGLARPMNTPEDYHAAVAQIRTHFKEQENALTQEITSLKEEVENLRTQLDLK